MKPTQRTIERAMIDRAGKKFNTAPERRFNDYQLARGMGLIQNVTLPFVAENRIGQLQRYDFQCDFLHPVDAACFKATGFRNPEAVYDVDYEIDGAGHKPCNDPWKDAIKNHRGLKVVHIPGYFVKPRYWNDLDRALAWAQRSKDMTVYLGLSP